MRLFYAFLLLIQTTSFAEGVHEAYQHNDIISGKLILTDLDKARCKIKKPNKQLIAYLEEKSDFLLTRSIKSPLSETGEFSFPVESRYADYILRIAVKASNFTVFSKTLQAYNAPKTYNLTLSCVRDIRTRKEE